MATAKLKRKPRLSKIDQQLRDKKKKKPKLS